MFSKLTMSYKILKQSLLINVTEKVFKRAVLFVARESRNHKEPFSVQLFKKSVIC